MNVNVKSKLPPPFVLGHTYVLKNGPHSPTSHLHPQGRMAVLLGPPVAMLLACAP